MGKKASGKKSTAKKKKSAPKKSEASDASAASPEKESAAGELASALQLHIWQIQPVRDVLFVLAVVMLIWIGYALSAVTVPLLVALLLAYLFEPIIDRLCKHPQITRVRAVSGILITVGATVVILLAIMLPLIVGQSIQLWNYAMSGEFRADSVEFVETRVPERVRDDVMSAVNVLPRGRGTDLTDLVTLPEPGTADRSGVSRETIKDWSSRVLGWIGWIVQAGLVAFLIPFYFFFFSLSYPGVVRFGRSLVPEKNKKRTLDLLRKMDRVVAGFVRGRIVISLIMGLMLAIGWKICGVPYAFALGFVTGIFCAVPYLGVVGLPVAIVFLFFEQAGVERASGLWWFWVLLWPSVVFTIVQLIEGYALTPMIAGKVTNLDPVTIIVAVLAGGSVLGVYGMLLSIPAAACGKILFTEVLLPRIREWTEGKASDPLPIGGD